MSLNFRNTTILVVEDTPVMAQMIEAILESLGVGNIIIAYDGREGFAKYCKHAPDIALIDWRMKPVDGLAMVKQIRQDPKSPNTRVPIIMMTGYNAVPRVREARDKGVTEYLVKPFSAHDLAKRLAYVVNKPRDFIMANAYFGPDRRRRADDNFNGPDKRS